MVAPCWLDKSWFPEIRKLATELPRRYSLQNGSCGMQSTGEAMIKVIANTSGLLGSSHHNVFQDWNCRRD